MCGNVCIGLEKSPGERFIGGETYLWLNTIVIVS